MCSVYMFGIFLCPGSRLAWYSHSCVVGERAHSWLCSQDSTVFVSLTQAVFRRREGGPSPTPAGHDPCNTLHSNPSLAFHSGSWWILHFSFGVRPMSWYLCPLVSPQVADLHSADAVHQWHLHPHKLRGIYQQYLLWCYHSWADCATYERAKLASTHQGNDRQQGYETFSVLNKNLWSIY